VPADILIEERRLFYVACTRARHQLHVSAVDEGDDGDERPSPFITEWLRSGVTAQAMPGHPTHAFTLSGLVAELRVAATDPSSSPARREAAIARLAQLAAQRDDSGAPLVPQADPDQWWGVAERTQGAGPIADPIRPVHMSGSRLDSLLNCPLRYFLTNVAHADVPRAASTAFGSVVHAVADFVAKGEVPASLPAMDAEVDRVWSELRYESAWQTAAERVEAHDALRRFLAYHDRADRSLVDTEVSMEATVEVPLPGGGTEPVHISGYIDRIERDLAGNLVAIDLKSTRTKPSGPELAEHGQLGLYQLMIRSGAYSADPDVDTIADSDETPGGAALVQLRMNESKKDHGPKVQMQEALADEPPTWVEHRLGQAVSIIRSEEFPAMRCKECRYCAYASVCPAQSEGGEINP
jgi:RecB family exonuclease